MAAVLSEEWSRLAGVSKINQNQWSQDKRSKNKHLDEVDEVGSEAPLTVDTAVGAEEPDPARDDELMLEDVGPAKGNDVPRYLPGNLSFKLW